MDALNEQTHHIERYMQISGRETNNFHSDLQRTLPRLQSASSRPKKKNEIRHTAPCFGRHGSLSLFWCVRGRGVSFLSQALAMPAAKQRETMNENQGSRAFPLYRFLAIGHK